MERILIFYYLIICLVMLTVMTQVSGQLCSCSSEQTHVADESFKENEFSLQLLDPQSQLVLTHLALLQVLKHTQYEAVASVLEDLCTNSD